VPSESRSDARRCQVQSLRALTEAEIAASRR
jgi:hypothetical protein